MKFQKHPRAMAGALAHLSSLSDQQRACVEDRIEAFEQAWQTAERPAIRDFLPTDPDIRKAILVELACIDLELRIKAGESAHFETYFFDFPELAEDANARSDLTRIQLASRTAPGDAADFVTEAQPALSNVSIASTVSRSQRTLPPNPGNGPSDLPQELSGGFGRYRVLRPLGRGAMGTVYLAEDTQLQRLVALKLQNFKDDGSGELLQRFQFEARAAAMLRHPNICPVHDIGEIEGRHFISMAYIEGKSLAAFVDPERRQSEAWILTIIRKLALALQVTHDSGIVHRDLKPTNVMIDERGEPIIMDFGLARLTRRDENVRLTRDGAILGSPAYMSPEQVEGNQSRIDARTDQYALGVILYELLTGCVPFQGSFAAVIGQILAKQPEPPSKRRPGLDPQIESICLRMLAKKPEERFRLLKDVADETSVILQASALTAEGSASPDTLRSPPGLLKRPRIVAAIGAMTALLAIGLLVWVVSRPQSNENSVSNDFVGTAASLPALAGSVNVLVWDPKNPSRRRLSLSDPGALPLRVGDQIRVEASLNRLGYIYLVWIGADGAALPVYPWKKGDWGTRPDKEERVASLSLPETPDEGWDLGGGPGMETLILLARDEPLRREFSLKDLFASLGPQPIQDVRSLVWLDQGEVSQDKTRAPKFIETSRIDDPFLKTQRILSEKLKPLFPLVRAVSFANKGP
jgi:serine/threonine protein kinase